MYEKDRGQSKVHSVNGGKARIDAKKSDAVCVCVCGGIGKESFSMSCCHPFKQLILTFTVNKWKDYAKQSKESDQNWLIRNASSFITTTPDPTHLWRSIKNWENLIGKFLYIHLIVLIYTIRLPFVLISLGKIDFKKGLWKSLVAVFRPEITKVLQWRDYGFISKKDSQTKRHIFDLINFI